MTYQELIDILKKNPPEVLSQDVTVYLHEQDEIIPVSGIIINFEREDNRLDDGHLLLDVPF